MSNRDLHTLTDTEFADLRRAVLEEKRRRDAAPAVEEALDDAAKEYHAANPAPTDPSGIPIWRQPQGAFDAWPVGAIVAHDGHHWRNTLPKVNVWQPGADGPVPTWERITDDPEAPDDPPVVPEEPTAPDDPPAAPGDPEPEPVPDPPPIPAWAPGIAYVTSELVTHDGTTYRVVQAHTSQAGWEPPAAPALWQPA